MSQKPAATFVIGELNFKVFDADFGNWYVEVNEDGEHDLNSSFPCSGYAVFDIIEHYEEQLA